MQSIPVQSWTFEHEPVIRIGRSTDNHVILYSAVVSRHHVEVRKVAAGWEIVNLGANGTYLEGKRITTVPVEDGVIIRLARSGPNVQIHLGKQGAETAKALGEKTLGQRARSGANVSSSNAPSVNQTDIPATDLPDVDTASLAAAKAAPPTSVQEEDIPDEFPEGQKTPLQPDSLQPAQEATNQDAVDGIALGDCCQQYVGSGQLFCLECGKPLRSLGQVGDYQLIKVLEQTELTRSYLGWKDGQTLELKTILSEWLKHTEVVTQFVQEAQHFLNIDHPSLPRFVEVLTAEEQPYLVMKPIFGRSLYQWITTQGPLPMSDAIAAILQVCDAIHHLHHQTPPILHQNIRPENLIRRGNTTPPTLTVAGLMPASNSAPISHIASGYTAPEQQQGQAFITSDLYALGPTLVYLLTGQPPNDFYAQRENGFRFYAEYVPGLDPELVPIIRKLTNPQPDDRYLSTDEVATALQPFASAHL